MSLVKVKDNKVTIPKKLRARLGINDGDYLDVEAKGKTLVLKKTEEEEEDDAFLLTPRWQKMQREAEKDIAEGRVSQVFDTAEEAIKALRSGKLKLCFIPSWET